MYVPLLKGLKGCPVYLEHGYPERAAAQVESSCMVWDLFDVDGKAIVLLISNRPNQRAPIPVLKPGETLTKEQAVELEKKKADFMYFEFRWIRADRVLFVRHDSGAYVDTAARTVAHEEVPPIYNDGKPGWEVMDAGVKYHIEKRLFQMGLRSVAPPKPGEEHASATIPETPEILVGPAPDMG